MGKITGKLLIRVAFASLIVLAGCKQETLRTYEGVAEGEVVRMAAPVAGHLRTLAVAPGASVQAGSRLFALTDPGKESLRGESDNALPKAAGNNLAGAAGADHGDLDQRKIQAAQSDWRSELQSSQAPVSGVVTETLFQRGDWVPAGAPVLTILAVEKIRVRFEVPLSVANGLQSGRRVKFECAGCAEPMNGTVTHVSSFATEDSSRLGSDSLRYRVEVRPDPGEAARFEPGQPVTVHL
ncbi:MAG: HlyD family secretion protein [Burkholderiales bacterium]